MKNQVGSDKTPNICFFSMPDDATRPRLRRLEFFDLCSRDFIFVLLGVQLKIGPDHGLGLGSSNSFKYVQITFAVS